jgi:hypothetical protein
MFKHIDIDAGLRRIAERKIEAAIEEGKFDNLEGAGKPLDLEPMPADENARMLWWALRLFKRNDVIPDEVKYRKSIEAIRASLPSAASEADLASRVATMNDLILKLNTMGTNAITSDLSPVDPDAVLNDWRAAAGKNVARALRS